jgi:tol-pal system protein YbgF
MAITDDSVRSLLRQFSRFRVSASEDLGALRAQLVQVQALQGASQQRMAELQRGLESRPVIPPLTADSAAQAAGPPPEGPAGLYRAGFSLLSRGSTASARAAFTEVLSKFPDSEFAPQALLRIGETYAGDKDQAAADSVWTLVVDRYPKSPSAPTALYKRANALETAGQTRRALDLYERIIREYSGAPEVTLARERAAALRGQ